jgi:hypothetical protein
MSLSELECNNSLENLDEFTRKQFIKRKPDANPFGDEENPTSWTELDVFAHVYSRDALIDLDSCIATAGNLAIR